MRSAYPSEWVEMIAIAQAMDVDVYVPGHGFVETPEILEEELQTYREAMELVIAEATRLHGMGLDVDAAAARAKFGELEEWTLRSSQGARAIEKVYEELNGELP
jgi:sugar phosphate isomerase/epimerase